MTMVFSMTVTKEMIRYFSQDICDFSTAYAVTQ
jgi:hypothetical protein